MKGIYGYWDKKNKYVVYIGKDSHITRKERNKAHNRPCYYDKQQINKVIQNNPERYEYFILTEGNFSDEELNSMECEAIEIFKTFKYEYPERSVFNFTKGGDGVSGYIPSEKTRQKISKALYRNDIDDNDIIDMYVNQKLNQNEIARKLNCTPTLISTRLRKNNIKLRKYSGENHNNYNDDLNDDEIIDLYVNQGLNTVEIADKYNTNPNLINHRLNKHGVDTSRGLNKRPDLNDDEIIDLYVNQGLSTLKIANKYNTNHSTILYRLNKNGINTNKNTSGYFRVSKHKSSSCKQGFRWRYVYKDNNGKQKEITSTDIKKLEVKVKEKNLPWKKL